MSRFKLTILMLVLAVVQTYFLSAISGVARAINLVLVMIVVMAPRTDPKTLLWLAWWGGLWLDIGAFDQFGWHMVWFISFAAILLGLTKLGIELKNRLQASIIILIGSFLYNLSLFAILSVSLKRFLPIIMFLPQWLAGGLIAAALLILVKPLRLGYVLQPRRFS